VSVSKRELNKWRREAESLRKRLGKLSAELDAIERLEPSPEAAERIAKQRAEIAELLDQLARIEEKIDSYEPFAPDWSLNDLLFMTAVTLGILLFLLILYVFIFSNFFSK
jgi:DNA repair exonuclease SbcCD ATPase subunit